MTETSKDEIKGSDFYIGTYTNGESKGIYEATLNSDGSISKPVLAVEASNPSYLAFSKDKDILLAVNENDPGTIESFQMDNGELKGINQTSTGGAHPCFVTTNDADYVMAANYSGGNIGLLQLDSKDGSLSQLLDVEQHEGKGTTDRQEGPHAHSAWFLPDGSGIVSADLGTNQLWFSKINTETNKLEPASPQKLDLAEGAGPRHLVFHPNNGFMYVLNELNNTVSRISKTDDFYQIEESISTLPEDFTEFSKAADIHISKDGNFIYTSNRGHNSIAIFSVNEAGSLELVGFEPTRGEEPRNFQISPDGKFILVANQNSNNLVSYKRDVNTGLMSYINEVKAPAPVCILFE